MSEDAIYLRSFDGSLERVALAPFETEEVLQTLIENYPEILAGEQIAPDRPLRWLLVTREAGIPGGEGDGDRWAVDHLLLDQDAVPTFVEVKRSSDTRIRREVVGQMLDYAANAPKYWPEDRIRELAAQQYEADGGSDSVVCRLLGETQQRDLAEGFWNQVAENLRTGRIRLLFVADRIPRELRRVIEFLNVHLDTIEVLGVEVRQYVGGELQALVPRIVGQTEAARDAKERSGRVSRRPIGWSEFSEKASPGNVPLFRSFLTEAEDAGLVVRWTSRGFNVRTPFADGEVALFYAFHRGANERVEDYILAYTGYLPDTVRGEAARRFTEVPGVVPRGDYTYEMTLDSDSEAGRLLWDSVRSVARLLEEERAEPHHPDR